MDENTRQVTVRLPQSTYDALAELARLSDRPVASEARYAIKRHLGEKG